MMPQPFNEKAVCPKCGSTAVLVQHHAPHFAPGAGVCAWEQRIARDDQEWTITHEHLKRECARCAFPWVERCLPIDAVTAIERAAVEVTPRDDAVRYTRFLPVTAHPWHVDAHERHKQVTGHDDSRILCFEGDEFREVRCNVCGNAIGAEPR